MNDNKNFLKWDNLGTALVTGASAGIGAEFAKQLAEKGFDLVLVARRKNRLDDLAIKLVQEYSIKADVLVADLSRPDDIEAVAQYILKIEKLDILVNNAGFGNPKEFIEWDWYESTEMINVHYTGPVRFCQVAIKRMSERKRGVIINVASAGVIAKMGLIYASSKAGLVMFSEMLKQKYNVRGIYIQALCPGFIHSEFFTARGNTSSEEDTIAPDWMDPEELVEISLDNVKSRHVVLVTGEKTRSLMKTLRQSNLKNYLNLKIL